MFMTKTHTHIYIYIYILKVKGHCLKLFLNQSLIWKAHVPNRLKSLSLVNVSGLKVYYFLIFL